MSQSSAGTPNHSLPLRGWYGKPSLGLSKSFFYAAHCMFWLAPCILWFLDHENFIELASMINIETSPYKNCAKSRAVGLLCSSLYQGIFVHSAQNIQYSAVSWIFKQTLPVLSSHIYYVVDFRRAYHSSCSRFVFLFHEVPRPVSHPAPTGRRNVDR